MHRLLVLRHGKSDWSDPTPDRMRPLAKRGVRAAHHIGRFLAEAGELPDLVLTSPAARARDTASLAVEAGEWQAPVVEVEDLYHTSVAGTLAVIAARGGTVERLMIVGHEPTWSALVGALIGGGDVRMPTAAVAAIDFDIGAWQEVPAGIGRLAWLVIPRLLTGGRMDG